MSLHLSSLIFSVLLGLALLLLPGMALLRVCVPPRALRLVRRLVLAPGVTIALCVLLFTWCDLLSLRLGPVTPWLLMVSALFILLFVRRGRRSCLTMCFVPESRRRMKRVLSWKLRRVPASEWLAAAGLIVTLTIFLVVRFNSTWGWCVPPGFDTAHHTMIVQLLLDHHGLFKSWAPYNDAETFTYHFGFHAIAALFAWTSRLDAATSVLIMTRVLGAAAAAALFALVRLWTRSPWGGVFAVVFWLLYTRNLYTFDYTGRWTLLSGLAVLVSALVLLSLYLRASAAAKKARVGLLCAITIGGLGLAQYKSAIIFAVLATALLCSRCIAELVYGGSDRFRGIFRIIGRILAVVILALLLAAPRINSVMEAKAGRYLKHIVFESPPADSNVFDRPTLNGLGILRVGFEKRRDAVLSALALVAGLAVVVWRREALWFVAGWGVVCLVMNPSLIGIDRVGLIDENHWKCAVPTAFAAMAGLGVGLVCEAAGRTRSFLWNSLLLGAVTALSLWEVARQSPLPVSCRYVLPEDVRLMAWIEQNVPNAEMVAGRASFEHGEALGLDATTWLPYFTRHQTNQTNLAAALEKAPPEPRERLRAFTRELYARDMSTPESAQWMRQEGFQWFYAGAIQPEWDAKLLDQITHNPALELVHSEEAARLYRVR
jgi:hypothetical protein